MPEARLDRMRKAYLDHSSEGQWRRFMNIMWRIQDGHPVTTQWIREQRYQEQLLCLPSQKPSNV